VLKNFKEICLNATFKAEFNPLQRCRSATEKIILEDLLSSVLSQHKKYHPSGNLKFYNLAIF